MLGPDVGQKARGSWVTLERLAWAAAIIVVGYLLGVFSVMAGQPFAAGPASLVTGLAVWRFLRRFSQKRQEATVEWLNAYVDAIDRPLHAPSRSRDTESGGLPPNQ